NRQQAARVALHLGAKSQLGQGEESRRPCGEARVRGGLEEATMTTAPLTLCPTGLSDPPRNDWSIRIGGHWHGRAKRAAVISHRLGHLRAAFRKRSALRISV